jgi:rhodanese-related sulfurtransferase
MFPVPSSVPLEVGVQDTQRLMAEKGADLKLIDVRDPDEYEHCRLAGAELIPLPTITTDAQAKLPDKDAEIIVYCHHGMRSLQAVEQLRAMGYANARSMAGGIDKWSQEIDSTVRRY